MTEHVKFSSLTEIKSTRDIVPWMMMAQQTTVDTFNPLIAIYISFTNRVVNIAINHQLTRLALEIGRAHV